MKRTTEYKKEFKKEYSFVFGSIIYIVFRSVKDLKKKMYETISNYQKENKKDEKKEEDYNSDEEISIEFNNNKKYINKRQYNGLNSILNENEKKKEENWILYEILLSCLQCFKLRREGSESEFIKLNSSSEI